jgi:hypothetical protein
MRPWRGAPRPLRNCSRRSTETGKPVFIFHSFKFNAAGRLGLSIFRSPGCVGQDSAGRETGASNPLQNAGALWPLAISAAVAGLSDRGDQRNMTPCKPDNLSTDSPLLGSRPCFH